jgi:hypothetical protein
VTKPAKESGVTAAASPGKPGPPNLAALAKSIEAGVAEVSKSWEKKPVARAAAPSRPAHPRVRLEWRPSVSWPEELQDAPVDAQPPGERAAVSWGDLSR